MGSEMCIRDRCSRWGKQVFVVEKRKWKGREGFEGVFDMWFGDNSIEAHKDDAVLGLILFFDCVLSWSVSEAVYGLWRRFSLYMDIGAIILRTIVVLFEIRGWLSSAACPRCRFVGG